MRSLFVWKMSTPSPTGKGKRLQRKQGHQHRNTNEQHEHYEGVTLPKIYSIEKFKRKRGLQHPPPRFKFQK